MIAYRVWRIPTPAMLFFAVLAPGRCQKGVNLSNVDGVWFHLSIHHLRWGVVDGLEIGSVGRLLRSKQEIHGLFRFDEKLIVVPA